MADSEKRRHTTTQCPSQLWARRRLTRRSRRERHRTQAPRSNRARRWHTSRHPAVCPPFASALCQLARRCGPESSSKTRKIAMPACQWRLRPCRTRVRPPRSCAHRIRNHSSRGRSCHAPRSIPQVVAVVKVGLPTQRPQHSARRPRRRRRPTSRTCSGHRRRQRSPQRNSSAHRPRRRPPLPSPCRLRPRLSARMMMPVGMTRAVGGEDGG